MKKIGIIQGRLLPPVENHIQEFPKNDWHQEFELLADLNLSHIEWIITEKSIPYNPIYKSGILKKYPINTICCDHLINNKIHNLEFLEKELKPVCEAALTHGINTIGIPLLEASSIEEPHKRDRFIKNINKIHENYTSLSFSFEAELAWQNIIDLVSTNDKFKITYDTGNITSHSGIDIHEEYINSVFHKIDNVHLKDRKLINGTWKTVFPTMGDTNFNIVFKILKSLGYDKNYTLQTARGITNLEKQTISYHKIMLEKLYERA